MKQNIKFLVMDVDGTLTDGKIYMGEAGELCKAFDIKDGYGIHDVLLPAGIVPVIITGRKSKILTNRCAELGIEEIHQGAKDKVAVLDGVLSAYSKADGVCYAYDSVAYIGDDLNDLPSMQRIQAGGGIAGCPADAVREVAACADFVSSRQGGNGAVREFIEWLVR